MVTEVKYPASSHYSDRYQREVARVWLDINTELKRRVVLPATLIERARAGYKAAWKRELLKHRQEAGRR